MTLDRAVRVMASYSSDSTLPYYSHSAGDTLQTKATAFCPKNFALRKDIALYDSNAFALSLQKAIPRSEQSKNFSFLMVSVQEVRSVSSVWGWLISIYENILRASDEHGFG